MFTAIAALICATIALGGAVVVDDAFYRLLNTVANMGTVVLLVWHQRHVRRNLEPKVDQTAAVVNRTLGERDNAHPETYRGPDRRKG